jgi:cytochrome c-type biogenesis protein CcmH
MRPIFVLALAALALASCNRNIEPYVPGEQPRQPDLSHIFPPGAEEAERLGSMAQGGGGPAAAGGGGPAAPAQGGDASADAAPIRGDVALAPALASRAAPGAVLYVIARTADTGPPLAVKRIESPHFPVAFSIGPGDRMIRAFPFAGAIKLSARLDGDGNAASRSPGDLQGTAPGTHAPGDDGVEIVLDQVL